MTLLIQLPFYNLFIYIQRKLPSRMYRQGTNPFCTSTREFFILFCILFDCYVIGGLFVGVLAVLFIEVRTHAFYWCKYTNLYWEITIVVCFLWQFNQSCMQGWKFTQRFPVLLASFVIRQNKNRSLITLPQFGITECLIQYKCSVHTPPSHAIRSG